MKKYISIFITVSILLLPNLHAKLVTSFEESEGYINGNALPSDDGWTTRNGIITNAYAFTGTQSLLRVGGSVNFAIRTFSLENNENYQEISYSFLATGYTGFNVTSDSYFYLVDEDSNSLGRVSIGTGYQNGTVNNVLRYKAGDSITVSLSLNADNILNLQEWNTITFSLNDVNDTFSIKLNGNTLVEDILPVELGNAVRIGSLFLLNSSSVGVNTYYDNITTIPESSALVFLLLGGMLLSTSRKK